jgi:long-chain acyl-CoA synthetase
MNFEQSLYESLRDTANKSPENNALLFMGKYMKYNELLDRVDKIAGGFLDMGLNEKDTVTMAMPNIFEAIIAFYALSKIGVVCHMVHPLTPVSQMEKFMQETKSETLIIIDTFYEHYQSLLRNNEVKFILASPVSLFGFIKKIGYKFINRNKLGKIEYDKQIIDFESLYSDTKAEIAALDSHDTACLLHSGGTSGHPKTIELSHFAINWLAGSADFILGKKEFKDKHMLAVLPMFHGFGLCMGIHGMFMYGGVNTLMPKFGTDETIAYIKKNQINYIIGVPSLYEALLHNPKFSCHQLENVEQCFVGGDYVAMDLKNRFDNVMKKNGSQARMLEGYGLTEVVTVCSVNTLRDHNQKSVGKPLPGIEIKIVNPKTKTFLKDDVAGEIAISAPTMMNGYLNDPEATKKTIIDIENKKWVLTGDLGFVDKDGYVHFKQRLKRIIKVSGIPVLPAEIESLVISFRDVKEAAAVGVPDKEKNFVIKLFIVLKKEANRDVIFSEIRNVIKKNLGIYAVPKFIDELDELPKTLIGKIDILKLEKM